MENNIDNENKIGAGIIVVSILVIINSVIAIIGNFRTIIDPNVQKNAADLYKKLNITYLTQPKIAFIISLIIAILTLISVILILNKKALGVYIYFTCFILNCIVSIIFRQFSLSTVLKGLPFSFILPILMLVFVIKKKNVLGLSNN